MTERAALRRRTGISQTELARLTGISSPRICLWEKRDIELRPEQVDKIAKVLHDRLHETPSFDSREELVSVLSASRSVEVLP
jgi:transcriptional regulator with XRE-family HTH domain